jgi:hypothetical protein
VHELRSSLVRGERRNPLAGKDSGARGKRAGDGSLAGISIRREETRRCDQRRETRQVNVVDQATIRYRGRRYEVPVLNLSSRGAMIDCELRPRIGARVDIRFADCNDTACSVRWLRDGRIGLEFDKETLMIGANDVRRPIVSGRRDGEQPTIAVRPQRSPRQASLLRANLHWPGGSFPVRLRNISQDGAMLQAGQDLDENSEIVLEIPHAAAIPGRVRWCRSKQIGVHFNDVFDLEMLINPPQANPDQPDYVKPDYLRTEMDPNSPWAARWSRLSNDDL